MKKVKDIKFSNLPEDIREKIIKAAKIVRDNVTKELEKEEYVRLRNTEWGTEKVYIFNQWFTNGIGDSRVYKNGDKYSTMIQITGHVENKEEDPNFEEFKKLIKHAFNSSKSEIKKLGFILVSEGECGDNFQGFDIWANNQISKELWEKFDDVEEKNIKESIIHEDATVQIPENELKDIPEVVDKKVASIEELPRNLQMVVEEANRLLYETSMSVFEKLSYDIDPYVCETIGGFTEDASCIGDTTLWIENNTCQGVIKLTPPFPIDETTERIFDHIVDSFGESFDQVFPTKHFTIYGDNTFCEYEMYLESDYAKLLWNKLDTSPVYECAKLFPRTKSVVENTEYLFMPIIESTNTEKKEISNLIASIKANNLTNRPDPTHISMINKIFKSICKIINNGHIQKWGSGWKSLNIKLINNGYQTPKTPVFLFVSPEDITDKTFAQRFINGHESFNAFQHRNPEITLKVNASALDTLKDPSDFYDFIQAAVKYYDRAMPELADNIQSEFLKLPSDYRNTILENDMYKIVGISLEQLYVFEKVNLSDPNKMFAIPKKMVKASLSMIKGLPKQIIGSKKQQRKIIDDYRKLLVSYYEHGSELNIANFISSLESFMNNEYKSFTETALQAFYNEQEDIDWRLHPYNDEIKHLQEAFFVKKLKKIPTDLVAYITIETEAIQDSNDKMMIASYCLSKLEIVEWYIELLEVGSKKYIVPHSLPYLNNIKTQLLACYDRIMKVKIIPPSERPVINIKYPKGYEG